MRLVIFDVDGTLADSQHNIVEAQGRAFATLGLSAPTRKRALSVVGLSLEEAFVQLVGASGPVDRLVDAYKEAWTNMRSEAGFAEPLYPGAREMIASLTGRSDLRLGIATGKSRKGVDRLLAEQGWNGIFATIHTADEHPSKPHPSMILTALAETGISATDTMMIGDTTFDMAMAVGAGVGPVGVAWGYHEAPALIASGAEVVVQDFTALRAVIDGMS